MPLLIIFIFTLFLPVPSTAQTLDDYKDSIDYTLDDDEMSQEEMEAEAIGIYNRCEGDLIKKTYYDCECIGGAFLSLREQLGPMVPQFNLMDQVYNDSSQCVDTAKIAGDSYQSCLSQVTISRYNQSDNDEYCSCVANTSAKFYQKTPSLNTRAITKIKTRAKIVCNQKFPTRN